jgi:acyl dehydratase
MEQFGTGFYFEEMPVGKTWKTVARTITEADMISFCNCTGITSELFCNLEYQKTQSVMKGRPIPGVFAYALCEGFGGQGPIRGTGLSMLNVELNIVQPVFIGDTIHCEVEVIESRESKSRTDSGLVRFKQNIVKQDGTVPITYNALRLIRRKTPRTNTR